MADVTLKKLDHVTLTVTVRVSREFRVRQWISLRLIRLAGWVMGFGVEVKAEK